jgi:CHAT domain
MTARTYDNFDLLIESLDEAVFRARVTSCTAGDTPTMRFSLPFSALELENLLLKLNPASIGTRSSLDPHAQASIELGGRLFDTVFRDDILLAWMRSVDAAREHQHGLRLRLRLSDAPSLAGLPWELLYDRKNRRFFAQSDRTPVVRYLDVNHPPRPLAVQGPLRILAVISSPHDLPPLDVEHEWSKIHEVLAERECMGRVVVDRLPYPSLSELQKWLRRHEVHVLHFVGHGDFDGRTGDGTLAFCGPLGRMAPVTSVQLGAHVRDHDPLRLVVLNACRTATTDNMDTFSGMAQGLIQQEAAAVVAMQFPISDGAAIAFTTDFYGALADGEPVDQALASARKALLTDFCHEWATPVLFLRAADGRIFDQIMPRTPAPAMRKAPVWDPEQTAVIPRITDSSPTRSAGVARQPTLPEATPPETPPLPKRHRRIRGRRAILVTAAAIAVAAVIPFALVQHGQTPHASPQTSPPGGRSSGSKTSSPPPSPSPSGTRTSTGPPSTSGSPSTTVCPSGSRLPKGN